MPTSTASATTWGCGVKLLGWVGTAKEDLLAFPDEVVREIGHALYVAQIGGKHASAKPLKGFGGASVLEIVEDFDGDAYRAVYTVRFAEAVRGSVCAARLPEEVDEGGRDAPARDRQGRIEIETGARGICGMEKKKKR